MQKWINRRMASVEFLETRRLFATFMVTNLNADGPGSLADAVNSSNAMVGSDVIEFGAAAVGTIQLSAQLEITDSLDVNGPGASALTIKAGGDPGATGAFSITADNPTTVSISGLTITGGDYDSGGSAVNNFSGDITIDSCVITGNFATGGDGGAIASEDGSLAIVNSTLTDNGSGGEGGGGAVNVIDGTLRISDCTISGNTSVGTFGGGGGVALSDADTIIENSTFSGNTESDGSGGAIESSGGTLLIRNSTISGNMATQGSEPERGRGGGIYISDGDVTLISTIVAGNTSASPYGGQDLSISETATPVTASHSLIQSVDAASLAAVSTANILGQDPMLAPLSNNGGDLQTQALLAGSPAIDAGSNEANLASDERGDAFARVQGAAPDIGAFESDGSSPAASPITVALDASQPPAVAGSSGYEFHVTFSGGVIDASSLDSADLVVMGPGNTPEQVQYLGIQTQGPTATIARYELLAPGGTIDATDNGAYNVSLVGGAVKDSAGLAVKAGMVGTFALVSGSAATADLAVTSASVTLPGVAIADASVKGRALVTVTDPGDAAEDSTVALYLSTDNSFDSGDILLAASAKPVHLTMGRAKRVKLKISAIPAATGATYQVLAVIDPSNTLAERDEANNVFATGVSISVGAARTDLAIALGTVPTSLTTGRKASASAIVTNAGNTPFAQSTTVSLFASTDGIFSNDDVQIATGTKLIRLAPNTAKTSKLKIAIPAGLPAGAYHLIAVVDPAQQIADADESNNAASTPGTIQLL